MENPFSAIENQLATINSKLDQLLNKVNPTEPELLTKREYLQKRKISTTTLWREEKNGQIAPIFIGSKKYYKVKENKDLLNNK